VLYLVLIELAEIVHIHIESLGVNYCGETVELDLVVLEILYRDYDIGEFAYARRLDQDPVRIVLLDDLVERLAEVSDQSAADAPRDHLVYLDAGVSQETGVYSDLTELILDEDYILVLITFGDELLDKCCLAGSEETGKNIDFSHDSLYLSVLLQGVTVPYIYSCTMWIIAPQNFK
jgi:hypothetical protein